MITNRDYNGDGAERRMGILHVRDKRHLCGTWGQRGNGICHPNCVVLGSLVTRFQDTALSGRYCHFDTVTIGRHSSSSIRTAEKQQPSPSRLQTQVNLLPTGSIQRNDGGERPPLSHGYFQLVASYSLPVERAWQSSVMNTGLLASPRR